MIPEECVGIVLVLLKLSVSACFCLFSSLRGRKPPFLLILKRLLTSHLCVMEVKVARTRGRVGNGGDIGKWPTKSRVLGG